MNTLQARAKAIILLRERRAVAQQEQQAGTSHGWRAWLAKWFPQATRFPFVERQIRLWNWFEALRPGELPAIPSLVEIWGRGGAKSTTAELGAVYSGSQFHRRFVLYVSAAQDQANKHVQSIQGKLETLGVGPAVGPYGSLKGWTVKLLRVAGGFNVLGLGLDAAARGVKLDDFRPDLIIFDDIDERLDTPKTVERKITTITETLLPTGAPECAILVVQNLIHANSIVSQLAEHRADFLHGAVIHQERAVEGLEVGATIEPDGTRRYHVVAGTPTWPGQDLATVTRQINTWGRGAFLREAQHDTSVVEGGLWNRERDIDPFRLPAAPELTRITVAVDPNAEGGEGNDAAGIMVGGRGKDGHGYLLEDATVPGGPKRWAESAVAAYRRWRANKLVAEKNNGGQMVAITIGTIPRAPAVQLVHASRGKMTRAEPIQKLAEEGRIHHVGVFIALEAELCQWEPGEPSPNRLDAFVWLFSDLMLGEVQHFSAAQYAVVKR